MPFAVKAQPNEPGAIIVTDAEPGEVGRFLHVSLHAFERRMSASGDVESRIIAQDDETRFAALLIAEALSK